MPTDGSIDFPDSDKAWMALQHHVIELTGKPIEDLQWRELNGLRQALTESEQLALRGYQRRKRLETSKAFDGIQSFTDWKEKHCDLTLEDIVDFYDTARAVTIRVIGAESIPDYLPVLQKIEQELFAEMNKTPGLIAEKDDSQEDWPIGTKLIRNLCRLLPTEENNEKLWDWYNKLKAKREELLQKAKDAQLTAPPTPAAPGNGRKPDMWFEELHKRSRDFERVCRIGIERGVIAQRGPYLYFNGKLLGNGLDGAAWKIVRENYELEAEVRLAVRAAEASPALTIAPATVEEALASGWQYARTRGKALTFDRRSLRGFVELTKEGTPGILEIPFVATVKHNAPRRRS
jgi:hypothetical protein